MLASVLLVAKLFRYLKWMGAAILSLLALYLIIAVVLSLLGTSPEPVECTDKKSLYIASNGLHLDFILERKHFTEQWNREIYLADQAEYLGFGWGDKEFYMNTPTWKDLSFMGAIRATFVKTDAALHLTAYQFYQEHWVELTLCESQFTTILNHIHQTFKTTGESYQLIPSTGYGPNDCFFEAHGNYNFIHTCNQWVNVGLKKAQVPTSIWSPFDRGILHHLRK